MTTKTTLPRSTKRLPASVTLTRAGTLYLVVQEGGSSVEHYPSFYNTETKAADAADGHRRATYSSTEPLAVEAHFDTDGHAYISEADVCELISAAIDAEYRS